MTKPLCPSQQHALDQLLQVLPLFHIVGLTGVSGAGKTTVLQEMHKRTGGAWICMRELLHALRAKHPLAIEETFEQIVEAALKSDAHVYIDELSLLSMVVQGGCGYPRPNLLASVLENLTALAEAERKKLIFSSLYNHHELSKKGYTGYIAAFTAEDYEFFCPAQFRPDQQRQPRRSAASHARRPQGRGRHHPEPRSQRCRAARTG